MRHVDPPAPTGPAPAATAPWRVWLQPEAPPTPAPGQPCNGCGLCCAAEPCPLGIWLSRRRRGACVALQWDAGASRYRCGALAEPKRWLPWLPRALAQPLLRRWIGAAQGCDSWLQRD